MPSFLLSIYFVVSTCELLPRVQLVTVIIAHVSKNVAVLRLSMDRTTSAVHELDTSALVVYKQ